MRPYAYRGPGPRLVRDGVRVRVRVRVRVIVRVRIRVGVRVRVQGPMSSPWRYWTMKVWWWSASPPCFGKSSLVWRYRRRGERR